MGKIPALTSPCKDCPFRIDCTKGWLGEKRMTEIIESESFTCHKTTNYKDGRKQCAGFMLIKDGKSAFEQLAKTLKEELNLSGRELIFDTEQDCINHHKH